MAASGATDAPPIAWLEATLEQVLRHATSLVERFPTLAGHWPQDRQGGHYDKLLGEAAMLLLGASRVPGAGLGKSVERLAGALELELASGRLEILLMRSRRNRGAALFPAVVMRLLGRPVVAIERLLAGSETIPENEAVPFRLAERAWVRFLAGDGTLPTDPFVRGSIFDGDPNVLEMDRTDLYAITHWAAYSTDMGAARAPDAMRAFVGARLRGAIAWQLADEDFDLLGEVIMAARMLRLPTTDEVRLSWTVLRTAWDQFGFLPSPSFSPPDFESREGIEQEAYAAAHIYHTNFVLGLLCAAELNVPPAEPVSFEHSLSFGQVAQEAKATGRRAGAYHDPSPLENVVGIAPRSAKPAFWQKAIGDQAGAHELVLEARLIRGIRCYDLAELGRALEEWIRAEAAPTLTFVEAVRFLTRQQVPRGAIGAHFVDGRNLAAPQSVVITSALVRLLDEAAAFLEGASDCRSGSAGERLALA